MDKSLDARNRNDRGVAGHKKYKATTVIPKKVRKHKSSNVFARLGSNEMPISEVYRRAIKGCPSISISPRRQQGRPCISGTSIPVHLVLWAVEQHGSIEGALKSYPDLNRQQVKDALYFAEIVMGATDMGPASVLTETATTT